jgi:hypothetical protein
MPLAVRYARVPLAPVPSTRKEAVRPPELRRDYGLPPLSDLARSVS